MFLKLNLFKSGSLKVRLSSFFVIALALILLPLTLFVYSQFEDEVTKNFDAFLYNYSSEVAESLNWSLFGDLKLSRKDLLAEQKVLPFSFKSTYLQIIDGNGHWLTGLGPLSSFRLPVDQSVLLTTLTQRAHFQTVKLYNNQPFRMISFPILKAQLPSKLILQIAVPTKELQLQKNKIKMYLWGTIPLLLIFIFITSYLFSGFILSPLHNIIKKTKTIKASNLDTRLPLMSDQDNELNQLSLTLNDLFDRLESAFKSQEEFIANASHQLKTPLAILRGRLDVFCAQPRTDSELNSLTSDLKDELKSLSNLVQHLLILASLDAGKNTLIKRELNLDDIIFEVVSRLNLLSEKFQVPLNIQITPTGSRALSENKIYGDDNLLSTLFQALIENAIQHSPPNQCVQIRIDSNEECFFVEIHNWGEPIPFENQKIIFDRFFQGHHNIKSQSGSVGLGLSIARDIALAHKAQLTLKSDLTHGTSFFFEIKKI